MKKTMMFIAVLIGSAMLTFGQADYKLMELVYLKPYPGADLDAASKAIAEHNKKFHSTAPFKASMWANNTGSMVGTWTWVMWPATFTDYDNRPTGKDHDVDWDKATSPYFETVANEYWREDDKLSYEPENFKSGSKVIFSVFDIKMGQTYRFKAILEKVSEVYKTKKYARNFSVYWNQFDNKLGRDVAIETMFDKWSFLDEDHSMKKDYEEIHGEGSWFDLVREFQDVVISVDDEFSVLMPEMSVE